MSKKFAMSAVGYAIVMVIVLGVVMIISAPMMADKYKNKNANPDTGNNNYNQVSGVHPVSSPVPSSSVPSSNGDYNMSEQNYADISSELRHMEQRFESRINDIERNQQEIMNNAHNSNSSVSDRYVCSIEGYLNENNDVVPIDNQTTSQDISNKKFVFVCEYKQ